MMHTIYNNFLRKFEFEDVIHNVPQTSQFCAQSFILNTLQMNTFTRKENDMWYRNELVFMDYPEVIWKQVV
jgi:hypothetical protein